MNNAIEFTQIEKFKISLYKDVPGLHRRQLIRSLSYLVPSIGLVIYAISTGTHGYGILDDSF